jgi:hypothetical protein
MGRRTITPSRLLGAVVPSSVRNGRNVGERRWGPMMERHTPESIYELLQHDHYTAEEVSRLLGIDVAVIRHAVFTGSLPAKIVGDDIVSIRREDVVRWFSEAQSG